MNDDESEQHQPVVPSIYQKSTYAMAAAVITLPNCKAGQGRSQSNPSPHSPVPPSSSAASPATKLEPSTGPHSLNAGPWTKHRLSLHQCRAMKQQKMDAASPSFSFFCVASSYSGSG
mmetsp:Transcript_23006/g.40084  ORF Transcript_23006/g.40084 Transcript_23006/m.40084 type:complete len:117 (-) Transcript_23006:929-1279(-)